VTSAHANVAWCTSKCADEQFHDDRNTVECMDQQTDHLHIYCEEVLNSYNRKCYNHETSNILHSVQGCGHVHVHDHARVRGSGLEEH
jgi:hypothetical protein